MTTSRYFCILLFLYNTQIMSATFSTKDGEFQEERKEFESFKRKLQRQLTQVEEEMDAQKRELTTGREILIDWL